MKMFGKSRKNSKAEAEVVGTPFDQADGELPDLSAGEAPVAAAEPSGPAPNLLQAPPAFESVGGKPKAGFTTAGATAAGLAFMDGDGTGFQLRIGPDYKKHGKKAPSAMHTYHPITMDVFKRSKISWHVASKLTLPPPPDGASTPNASGLPRRIVVNAILPAEGPPLIGGDPDGKCYQVVIVFGASSEALCNWEKEGSPACKLFTRFATQAPEGILPDSGDKEVKERLKLLPRLDNMDKLGLPGWITGYNGKPALVTKSGALYKGEDYLEIDMNCFRFGERALSLLTLFSLSLSGADALYLSSHLQASSRRRASITSTRASRSSTSTRR